jgi:hypothetical protein
MEAIRSMTRRVVVLTPDLSTNAVGRALVFVDMLTGFREVTLAGSRTGPLWPPLAARSDIGVVELPRNPLTAAGVVRRRWPDAIIIASKPLLTSYGVALASRRQPIVLDIDDPELALATADARTLASTLLKTTNPLVTAGLSIARRAAAAVTVANGVLQSRYGGSVIPHARDERIFDETFRDRASSREALGLSGEDCIVAYVGTFRAHKGISDLRLAARRWPPGVKLALVGGADGGGAYNEILVAPGPYISTMRWVSAADIIVVPQRRSRVGRAQSPAKLIDALAMGRAIVATRMPPVVEAVGAGAVLVEPESTNGLGRAVMSLVERTDLRLELEAAGRTRFLERFSFEVVRPGLQRLLDEIP